MPSAVTGGVRAESVDAADRLLLEQAHVCTTMPDIRKVVRFGSLAEVWRQRVDSAPQRVFLTYYPCVEREERPRAWSYGEFDWLIHRWMGCLSNGLGIGAGDVVATLTRNQPTTVGLYMAAWRLGALVVPINPAETDERAAYIVGNSQARALVIHTGLADRFDSLDRVIGAEVRRAVVRENDGPAADVPAGWLDLAAMANECQPGDAPAEAAAWDAAALMVYTSGTTGLPKGVLLTQGQLLADAHAIAEWHGVDQGTTMMNVLPIHHVNGTVVTLVTPLYAGAGVVLNQRFTPRGFWQKLSRHEVGIVSVVPTLLQFLLEANESIEAVDLKAFRHFICGAGPLTVELAREFQERFGLRIVHGYGLSETTCYSCFLPVDLDAEAHGRWMYDHGFPSIGVALPTNEMAIHDEQGRPLGPGERGEIVIRGHNVMSWYVGDPQANRETFAHGWFRSGDEGFFLAGQDGRDYFFITGRLKDVIIRGGVNVSTFDIDEVLSSIPGVRVGLAVGFENRYYGEEVGAYVQLDDGAEVGEEEILRACARRLDFAKRPKVVLFGDDPPVTSTGKYQRGRLKDRFARWKDTQFRGE
jgi:long-chain acyl-CoA synthetase